MRPLLPLFVPLAAGAAAGGGMEAAAPSDPRAVLERTAARAVGADAEIVECTLPRRVRRALRRAPVQGPARALDGNGAEIGPGAVLVSGTQVLAAAPPGAAAVSAFLGEHGTLRVEWNRQGNGAAGCGTVALEPPRIVEGVVVGVPTDAAGLSVEVRGCGSSARAEHAPDGSWAFRLAVPADAADCRLRATLRRDHERALGEELRLPGSAGARGVPEAITLVDGRIVLPAPANPDWEPDERGEEAAGEGDGPAE